MRQPAPTTTEDTAAFSVAASDVDYALRATLDSPDGVAICANNPSGADIALGGPAAQTLLSEHGIHFVSDAPVVYALTNSGPYGLDLTLNGESVATEGHTHNADFACQLEGQFIFGLDANGVPLCGEPLECFDEDGDGASPQGGVCGLPADCDDEDQTSYPDAVELCDLIDNDCDGTADDGAGCIFQSEVEPNDTPGEATARNGTSTMEGEIDPIGDEDWYAFTVTETSQVTLYTLRGVDDRCVPTADGIDTEIWLYEDDGVTDIAFNDDDGTSFCSLIGVTLDAGDYRVRVLSSQLYAPESTFDYRLDIEIEPCPDC